ncbi:MAG: hypothetical protein MZW92_58605 [Comamonadaceae bacterium]|nr:hypothetical protein [Comamonadaceae bacterium]
MQVAPGAARQRCRGAPASRPATSCSPPTAGGCAGSTTRASGCAPGAPFELAGRARPACCCAARRARRPHAPVLSLAEDPAADDAAREQRGWLGADAPAPRHGCAAARSRGRRSARRCRRRRPRRAPARSPAGAAVLALLLIAVHLGVADAVLRRAAGNADTRAAAAGHRVRAHAGAGRAAAVAPARAAAPTAAARRAAAARGAGGAGAQPPRRRRRWPIGRAPSHGPPATRKPPAGGAALLPVAERAADARSRRAGTPQLAHPARGAGRSAACGRRLRMAAVDAPDLRAHRQRTAARCRAGARSSGVRSGTRCQVHLDVSDRAWRSRRW